MRSLEIGELRIPVAQIRQGIQDFEFRSVHPGLQVGMPEPQGREASVRVHVTPLGDQFLAEIDVETEGGFLCDRCGEEYRRSVQGQVKTLFVTASGGPLPDKEDVRFLAPEAPFIDVLPDATDAVQLAVSAKNLCRESCRGLCAQCGINLNEGSCACAEAPPDPRWDALKNIRFDA